MRPAAAARNVSILGATGSIGTSTIDLLLRQRDRFQVEAVTAQRNADALAKTAIALGAKFAAIAEPETYAALKSALSGSGIAAAAGEEAIIEAAARPADLVVASISGAAGLAPSPGIVRMSPQIG